jgi:glycosyltransferase involved in cell wall biosynthesis
MLLNKDYATDPRVLKETSTLRTKGGHHVTVLCNLSKLKTKSIPRFVLNLFRFYGRCLINAHAVNRLSRIEAVHAHDFDTLPIGFLLSRIYGVPLVYDAHEVYSYLISQDVPATISNTIFSIERMLTRHVDRVIAVSRNVAVGVSEKPNECWMVMNCPPALERAKTRKPPPYRMGYIGALEPGRFVLEGIEAIRKVPAWEFVIAGRGSLVLPAAVERVHYMGQLDREKALDLMASCDLQMVMFDPDNANSVIGMPNRLFEAMAMSQPVVATHETDAGRLVKELSSGFVVSYDPISFATLLNYLAGSPDQLSLKGMNGLAAWRDKYNWERQEGILLNAYSQLWAGDRHR